MNMMATPRDMQNDMSSRIMRALVVFVFAVLTTVGAFNGGMWAGGGIGLAILLFIICWASMHKIPRPDMRYLGLVVVVLMITAGMNMLSQFPAVSWNAWVNLVTIFIPLTLLTAPEIQKRAFAPEALPWLSYTLLAGVLALGLELLLGGKLLHIVKGYDAQITDYNRGMVFIVLIAFPVLAGLWNTKRRWMILPFILILLLPASITESRTAKLALISGLLVTVLASYAPQLVRWVLTFGIFPLAGWPFMAQWIFTHHHDWVVKLPASWGARMEIWDYMSYRIAESPIIGWGLGVAHRLDFMHPHGAAYTYTLSPAGHPHNVFTELWVELGIPGLILGFLFALYTLDKIARRDARIRPFAYGAWVVAICIVLVGFDFWSDAYFAAIALTAFAFAGLERNLGSALFATAVSKRGRAADNPDNAKQVV